MIRLFSTSIRLLLCTSLSGFLTSSLEYTAVTPNESSLGGTSGWTVLKDSFIKSFESLGGGGSDGGAGDLTGACVMLTGDPGQEDSS